MPKRLSKTQMQVLRWMAEPGAILYYVKWGFRSAPYWFVSRTGGNKHGKNKRVRYRTGDALLARGLLRRTNTPFCNEDNATITDAGRKEAEEAKENA